MPDVSHTSDEHFWQPSPPDASQLQFSDCALSVELKVIYAMRPNKESREQLVTRCLLKERN